MNTRWIAILRITVGIFFLAQGLHKLDWFNSSEYLKLNLDRYAQNAHPAALWYQDHVAKPGIEAWSRLIPMSEMLIGISLILGLLTQTTLIIATALVVNFHIANGIFFTPGFFSNPFAMLLLVCLIVLWFLKPAATWAIDGSSRKKKMKMG
jgi:uncharacterized membrane protein YphA (DoxX/SURF4 family)